MNDETWTRTALPPAEQETRLRISGGACEAAAKLIAGKYRLEEPLGTGGMGSVFRAFDETLHRPVALDFIAMELADGGTLKTLMRSTMTGLLPSATSSASKPQPR